MRDPQYWNNVKEKADTDRSRYKRDWEDIINVLAPIYGHVNTQYQSEPGRSSEIFDSSPMQAKDEFVDSYHGAMFPMHTPHVQMTVRNDAIARAFPELVEWCAYVTSDITKTYRISNFSPKSRQVVDGLTCFGFGTMLLETYPFSDHRYGEYIFTSMPFNESFPIEGKEGFVDTHIREFYMSIDNILARADWHVPEGHDLRAKAQSDPMKKVMIRHVIAPKKHDEQTVLKSMEYISIYYLVDGDNLILNGRNNVYEGYEELPIFCPRWESLPGDSVGRGPASNVIGDAMNAQVNKKNRLKAAQLQISPPLYEVKGQVTGRVAWQPAAINQVERPDALGAVQTGARMDIGLVEDEKLDRDIQNGFFQSQFKIPEDRPQMTAEEAVIRQGQGQSIFSSKIARQAYEWIYPQSKRMFWIRYRAGKYPPPPGLDKITQEDFGFEIINPIAMNQRIWEVRASRTLLNDMAQYGEVFPDMLDHFDQDAYMAWRVERESSSMFSFLRGPEAIAGIRERRQQQQMAAQLPDAMKSLKDASVAGVNVKKAQNE